MENNRKVYVTVKAIYYADGKVTPLCIYWEDGTVYEVDRVLSVYQRPALIAGGHGLRYIVRIQNREAYLFLEDGTGRWFVERK